MVKTKVSIDFREKHQIIQNKDYNITLILGPRTVSGKFVAAK